MVQEDLLLRYPLRIAIPAVSSRAWLGGFNYQLNLARSLASHASDKINPVVFFGDDADDDDVAAFAASPDVEVVRDVSFSRQGQAVRQMRALLLGLDIDAAKAFAARKIDIVFEPARFFGRCLKQPAIAWFPDFQHRRMPQMFNRLARWRREIGFRVQLRYDRTILLSSKDAQNDCENYYPQSKGKTRVLRFPAMIETKDLASDPKLVLSQYQIPDQFIYLPNQFWRHKNHAVVIEALGLLRRRGSDVRVVATGNPSDPRDPVLFARLMGRLDELGATSMFQMLGIIPRSHVIALMQTCSALINPSVCEGWSTGVEEAKLLGVPMILSDIAVHREQAGKAAMYFDVNDAVAVADILAATSQIIFDCPRALVGNAANIAQAFAAEFAEIASEAYERRRW